MNGRSPTMTVVTAQKLMAEAGLPPNPEFASLVGYATRNWALRASCAFGSLISVAFGTLVFSWMTKDDLFARQPLSPPVAGLTIFALFFTSALALERLLEPVAGLLGIDKTEQNAKKAESDAKEKAHNLAPGQQHELADKLTEAAAQTQNVADWRFVRTTTFWALATVLAVAASAAFHLYFLRTIGVSVQYRWADILATGLIIGGGTKPLHDLVTLITAAKS